MYVEVRGLWELVLSFPHVSPGGWTQIVRPGAHRTGLGLESFFLSMSLRNIILSWFFPVHWQFLLYFVLCIFHNGKCLRCSKTVSFKLPLFYAHVLPASGALQLCLGLPRSQDVSSLGTGLQMAVTRPCFLLHSLPSWLHPLSRH